MVLLYFYSHAGLAITMLDGGLLWNKSHSFMAGMRCSAQSVCNANTSRILLGQRQRRRTHNQTCCTSISFTSPHPRTELSWAGHQQKLV